MSLFKNPHANQRYFERVHPDTASKKDIVKALQHPSNVEYIKRLTEGRSMVYIHLPNDNIVKAIINKRKKEIVTILPWKDIYKIEIPIHNLINYYIVDFYPDCFLETNNPSTLNKIKKYQYANFMYEYIEYNNSDFEPIILKAWEKYEKNNPEKETKES